MFPTSQPGQVQLEEFSPRLWGVSFILGRSAAGTLFSPRLWGCF
ncbi:hypothetical protein O0544_20625 [Edwardsiella anguillarum]|nr:hypothetical protein [Edwardsiella anguillarum]